MSDLSQIYMNQVRRHPRLTPAETHELAVRVFEEGDTEACDKLVVSNLRLVVTIARSYPRQGSLLPDLIQEGSIGLVVAVKKYDPYRGAKLSTYAGWWIRAYMLQHILNNHRMVKMGTTATQRKLFWNLEKERQRLAAQGIEATPSQLAENLSASERDVVSMSGRLQQDKSFDVPISEEEGSPTFVDVFPDDNTPVDEQVARKEELEQFLVVLAEFRNTLSKTKKKILDERILGDPPKRQSQLAEELGMTKQNVHQQEQRLRKSLTTLIKG